MDEAKKTRLLSHGRRDEAALVLTVFQSKQTTPCAVVLSDVNTPIVPAAGTPGIGTFTVAAGSTAGIGCDHRFVTPKRVTARAFHVVGTLL